MSFGNAFGAFASGAAGGMAMGKHLKQGLSDKALSDTVTPDGDKPTGFGLGESLVSGEAGSATFAASPTEGSDKSKPWSSLSSLLDGLGGLGGAAGGLLGKDNPLEGSAAGKLIGGGLGNTIIGKILK